MYWMFKEHNINLEENKFTVEIDKEFLYNLIERVVNKFDFYKDLYLVLFKNYHLLRYDKKNLGNIIRRWQRKRQRIPLDYFLAFGDIINYKKEVLFKNIISLNFKGSRVSLRCGYPIKLTKELASISELIKVEGYLTRRKCVFENTNTELTALLKNRLIVFGVDKKNIKERLHIRIQIPEKLSKKNFKILNLNRNIYIKNFYERILNLKKGIKKELIFSELNFNYNKYLKYRVFYKDKYFDISIRVPLQDKIYCQSNFCDNRYQKITVSLRMDVFNATLAYILNNVFEVPYWKKSNNIFIPKIIKDSSPDILKNVISVVFAAESTIAVKDRFVSLTSLSKHYLKDLHDILLKFNIINTINKNTLNIYGIYNFHKILDNFDFIIKNKCYSMNLLVENSRMLQSPKGLSKVLYLQSLNKLSGIATSLEIRNNANRRGHSFRIYLKELFDKGYIHLIRDTWPRKYRISDSGKRFLKENESYWLR